MITVRNVNKIQQKLLDKMWEIGDIDDLETWKDTLNPKLRQEVELLQELVMLAVYDELVNETEEDFTEANEIIARCRKFKI